MLERLKHTIGHILLDWPYGLLGKRQDAIAAWNRAQEESK